MPTVSDYRVATFDVGRVHAAGRNLARQVYWKLYSIENLLRVLIHSVLVVEIGMDWWVVSANPRIQKRVRNLMSSYAQQPWHAAPGKHEIYYTFLPDLIEILRANRHLFLPVIPDIDQWVARIEQVRLPRNNVGHMNWIGTPDRRRIDVFHLDIQALMRHLAATLTLIIP